MAGKNIDNHTPFALPIHFIDRHAIADNRTDTNFLEPRAAGTQDEFSPYRLGTRIDLHLAEIGLNGNYRTY
jgi:hypothetical protein